MAYCAANRILLPFIASNLNQVPHIIQLAPGVLFFNPMNFKNVAYPLVNLNVSRIPFVTNKGPAEKRRRCVLKDRQADAFHWFMDEWTRSVLSRRIAVAISTAWWKIPLEQFTDVVTFQAFNWDYDRIQEKLVCRYIVRDVPCGGISKKSDCVLMAVPVLKRFRRRVPWRSLRLEITKDLSECHVIASH
jgi:hypothetical protein